MKPKIKVADLAKALQGIETDRQLTKEIVEDALKEALTKAYRKHIEIPDAYVRVDVEDGTIHIYHERMAVEEVEDDELEIELEEAQKEVDKWIKTYGVRYFSELTNMAVLTEEVGELARVMARKYGDQSFKEGEKDNLDEEIADILWVLLCIANQTGVDITKAFRESLEKKTKRDNKRHINNPKLNDHGRE